MDFENLTPEQITRAKTCKSAEELAQLVDEYGYELTDEELDSISGGYENCDNEVNSCYVFWTACDTNYKCFSASGAS